MSSPSRFDALPPRAAERLREHGFELRDVAPLAGDVSLRRYSRVELADGATAILAVYPAQIATTCERFADSTSLLQAHGIASPKILLSLCDDGLMLLEDLGERTLYDQRDQDWPALTPFLRHAAALTASIGCLPIEAVRDLNPPLDADLLSAELARTWELLLGDDGVLPGALPTGLAAALDDMIEQLSKAPQGPCHRDFMARNLVPLPEAPQLAVIDHQDIRIGPQVYDLASLLNDSLFPPTDLEMEIALPHLPTVADHSAYHRAASQRALKAVGTFVGFARRGDSRHETLVTPTLARARHHLHLLPEMELPGSQIDTLCTELLAALTPEEPTDSTLLD